MRTKTMWVGSLGLYLIILLLGTPITGAAQSNRSLIKTASSPTVYWIQSNRIYGIVNGNLVTTMQNAGIPGWSFSSITTVSSIAAYGRGPDFISANASSNGLLVKRYLDSAVYVISNGRKEFLSSAEFARRGFNFADVIDVAQSILDQFPNVPPPNFAISPTPGSRSVTRGQNATFTVTVQNLNGFNSGVSLQVLGLPGNQVLPGTGFNPQTVVPSPNTSASSTLSIVTNGQTPTGTFPLTIQGTGNGVARAVTVNLTVTAPADFTITATPASRTVTQGGSAGYTVSVQSLNGFSGSVGLFALGLPAGQPLPGTGFSPQTVAVQANGVASSTLTIVTNGQTPANNYPITIEGRNGNLTRSASINLIVNRASDATPPEVRAFNVTDPRAIVEGLAFTITYTVFDAGSGLNRVELWRASEGSNGQLDSSTWREIKRNTHSGTSPANGSFTDAPAIGGRYWYGLHVLDNAGNQRNEAAPLLAEVYREPIILIHGYSGGPGTFGNMKPLLEGIQTPGKRFKVFNFDYHTETGIGTGSDRPAIEVLAGRLKSCIDAIRSRNGIRFCLNLAQLTDDERKQVRAAPSIHIIAHSMGGLVARSYLSGIARMDGSSATIPYQDDVGKFITLATPHFGVTWPAATGTQVAQMSYGSRFQWNLHKAWTASRYWLNSRNNLLAIVALGDGIVTDYSSAAYLTGFNVLTRFVYKDHFSYESSSNHWDSVAYADGCHSSYELIQTFLRFGTATATGSTACHSQGGRDERWRDTSTKNEGSLLLRVVNESGNPVRVLNVFNSPGTLSTRGTSDPDYGTYHIRGMATGLYQITVTLSPPGTYQDIVANSVIINQGRTRVLELTARRRTALLAYRFNSSAPIETSSMVKGSLVDSRALYPITEAVTPAVATVSAASFVEGPLAPETIAATFGTDLATATAVVTTLELPVVLAGTTVNVKDSLGVERLALILFVSPSQVNYLVPAGTAVGEATITITNRDGHESTSRVRIESVAPGLFSANAGGEGWASALALRIKADGTQQYEPLVEFDTVQNRFIARPLELGSAKEQVYLLFFGTGMRLRNSLSSVSVKLGGLGAEVLYVGSQGGFAGLDQVNVRIPPSLAGRGEVEVKLTIDGKAANPVKINFH